MERCFPDEFGDSTSTLCAGAGASLDREWNSKHAGPVEALTGLDPIDGDGGGRIQIGVAIGSCDQLNGGNRHAEWTHVDG
jgi:hypothetical protein